MHARTKFAWVCTAFLAVTAIADERNTSEPMAPKEIVPLFNGQNLTGLTTWLKDTKREDPRGVFQVSDGMLHLSGDGLGYVGTEKAYRDYRLVVEYRWGQRTDGREFVRNSGLLLHVTGPDGGSGGSGGSGGAWPACIECQLAQGCVGDFIVIRGKSSDDDFIPVRLTAETELAPDQKRHRWKRGGEAKTFPPTRGQLWWSLHDWDFRERIDTRGKNDIESALGEWTRVECICDGNRITVRVNGETVNECRDVFPASGRILLQTEGFEIMFRKFELHPLKAK